MYIPLMAFKATNPTQARADGRAAFAAWRQALAAAANFHPIGHPELSPALTHQPDRSFTAVGYWVHNKAARHVLIPGLNYNRRLDLLIPNSSGSNAEPFTQGLESLGFTFPALDGLGGTLSAHSHRPEDPWTQQVSEMTGWAFHLYGAPEAPEVYASTQHRHLTSPNVDTPDPSRWVPVDVEELHAAHQAAGRNQEAFGDDFGLSSQTVYNPTARTMYVPLRRTGDPLIVAR